MAKAKKNRQSETQNPLDELRWMGDYPISGNKTVMISLLVVSTISVGLVAMLVLGLAIQEGNYQFVARILKGFGIFWLVFTGAFFLIAILFLGGKMSMEVVIDDQGVVQAMLNKRTRMASLLAIFGGLAAGGARGYSAAGAGMLAQARQVEGYAYKDLRQAKGNPQTGEIRLWDEWHTVMQFFVPLQMYQQAMERIQQGINQAATKRVPTQDIPTAVKALVVFAAVLFGGFLLLDFPLAFSFLFVIPMVILTVMTILSNPVRRRWRGWLLAGSIVISVAILFQMKPPSLYQEGAGLVIGIQLVILGLFTIFGTCAGLGVFNLNHSRFSS
ncbi:MAG: hypothetical protein QM496_06755 [Verrucomicrobiota bacterium]